MIESIRTRLDVKQKEEYNLIEVNIDADFNTFSHEKEAEIINLFEKTFKEKSEIYVLNKKEGSVKITFIMSQESAENLFVLIKSGKLTQHGIKDARLGKFPRKFNSSQYKFGKQ